MKEHHFCSGSALRKAGALMAGLFMIPGLYAAPELSGAVSSTDSRLTDHGVPAPVSLSRGSVATTDAEGKRRRLPFRFIPWW